MNAPIVNTLFSATFALLLLIIVAGTASRFAKRDNFIRRMKQEIVNLKYHYQNTKEIRIETTKQKRRIYKELSSFAEKMKLKPEVKNGILSIKK